MITEFEAIKLVRKVRDIVFPYRNGLHVNLTFPKGYSSTKTLLHEGLQTLVTENRDVDSIFFVINLEISKKFLNRKTIKEEDLVSFIAHEFHHAKDIMGKKIRFEGKKIFYDNEEFRLRYNVNERVYEYVKVLTGKVQYFTPWEVNVRQLDDYVVRMVCGERKV